MKIVRKNQKNTEMEKNHEDEEMRIDDEGLDQFEETFNLLENKTTKDNFKQKVTKKKIERKKWSPEIKKLALEIFKHYIKIKKTPGKSECEEFLEKNNLGNERKWQDVKNLIKNTFY